MDNDLLLMLFNKSKFFLTQSKCNTGAGTDDVLSPHASSSSSRYIWVYLFFLIFPPYIFCIFWNLLHLPHYLNLAEIAFAMSFLF